MVTRKRTIRKVAEAAPTYTAASGKAMPGELGAAVWEMFAKLSDEEQGAFLRKMLATEEQREDMMDICTIIDRQNDPKDDYEEFEKELQREGLL